MSNIRNVIPFICVVFVTGCLTPDPMDPDPSPVSGVPAGGSEASETNPSIPNGGGFDENDWGQQNNAPQGFSTIYFAYDQATITPSMQAALAGVAQRMKAEQNYDVQIEGHCDERGSTEYNLALGDRRANSVRQYLIEMGVPGGRLSTISYGEEKPTQEGHDEQQWAQNRRVEFMVAGVSH